MKIFITKKFKEIINQPYNRIELSKLKLKGNAHIDSLSSDNLNSKEFLSETSPSTTDYYEFEAVKYNNGIQIYFDIPKTDASLFEDYYQVILIFYTDLIQNKNELAFIIFENFIDNTFSDLKLTPKNIINIPLDWKCDIKFKEDDLTKFLENKYGQIIEDQKHYLATTKFSSKESVLAGSIESDSKQLSKYGTRNFQGFKEIDLINHKSGIIVFDEREKYLDFYHDKPWEIKTNKTNLIKYLNLKVNGETKEVVKGDNEYGKSKIYFDLGDIKTIPNNTFDILDYSELINDPKTNIPEYILGDVKLNFYFRPELPVFHIYTTDYAEVFDELVMYKNGTNYEREIIITSNYITRVLDLNIPEKIVYINGKRIIVDQSKPEKLFEYLFRPGIDIIKKSSGYDSKLGYCVRYKIIEKKSKTWIPVLEDFNVNPGGIEIYKLIHSKKNIKLQTSNKKAVIVRTKKGLYNSDIYDGSDWYSLLKKDTTEQINVSVYKQELALEIGKTYIIQGNFTTISGNKEITITKDTENIFIYGNDNLVSVYLLFDSAEDVEYLSLIQNDNIIATIYNKQPYKKINLIPDYNYVAQVDDKTLTFKISRSNVEKIFTFDYDGEELLAWSGTETGTTTRPTS